MSSPVFQYPHLGFAFMVYLKVMYILQNTVEKKRIATRNSNATYICSKVKAELDADNKIIKIEISQLNLVEEHKIKK